MEYINTTGSRQILTFSSVLNYYIFNSATPTKNRDIIVVDIPKNFSIVSAKLIIQMIGVANNFHFYKDPNYYMKGFQPYGYYEIASATDITSEVGGPWSINSLTPTTSSSTIHLKRGLNVFYMDTPVNVTDAHATIWTTIVVDGFFERLT